MHLPSTALATLVLIDEKEREKRRTHIQVLDITISAPPPSPQETARHSHYYPWTFLMPSMAHWTSSIRLWHLCKTNKIKLLQWQGWTWARSSLPLATLDHFNDVKTMQVRTADGSCEMDWQCKHHYHFRYLRALSNSHWCKETESMKVISYKHGFSSHYYSNKRACSSRCSHQGHSFLPNRVPSTTKNTSDVVPWATNLYESLPIYSYSSPASSSTDESSMIYNGKKTKKKWEKKPKTLPRKSKASWSMRKRNRSVGLIIIIIITKIAIAIFAKIWSPILSLYCHS